MKELDHEHRSFEKYAKSEGLNREMHPLHLLYLDDTTNMALGVFKAGYSAGKEHLTDLQAQNDELRAKLDLIQDAYLDVEIKAEVLSVEKDDESNAQLAKARYMLGRAIGKTPAQSLADIRAEAVIEAANAVVRHNECGFCLHCLLIDHANKIKGAE